ELVHDAAQSGYNHGHRDGCTGVGPIHAAAQSDGSARGDGTHHADAQLLVNLQRHGFFSESGAVTREPERVVDVGNAVAGELNIHHGADALNDGTVAHV